MRGRRVFEGLSSRAAAALLEQDGPNELAEGPRDGLSKRVLRQFLEPMALLLIAAAAISAVALREWVDAVAILAIVILNALIGLFQETKGEHALEALRDMQTPVSRVLRDGSVRSLPASQIVRGDVVILAGGDRIPADGRLVEATALEVDESLLTGESLPVGKSPEEDELFSGTYVTSGTAQLEVLATGPRTRLARIAEGLQTEKPPTPLQLELRRATIILGGLAVAIAAVVFLLTYLRSGTLEEAFLTSISLAVAAVPEGLATVVTVALALGVRRMATEGAIVRNLASVETLGATTVLATDKTGTLTENRMRTALVVDAAGGAAEGAVRARLTEAAIACNDATLDPPTGDPLELALLEWARPSRRLVRVAEAPFESSRKMMSTINEATTGYVMYTKGAPEQVIAASTHRLADDGTSIPLEGSDRAGSLSTAQEAASSGARLIAFAYRTFTTLPDVPIEEERELTLLGFIGLRDPVRPEAADAVATARDAGVEVVMVTGDHPGTAGWVAGEVGIATATGDGHVVAKHHGEDVRPGASIYARVDPEDKIGLVRGFQQMGEVVAVTGDGVNDGPALRGANIGIAMGARGTDVARAAADIVITDDNLATIVHAIREGRSIYDNIRRVVQYLVAANLSEILVVITGLLMFPALAPPLVPLQLLWINLVTDGLPALALGMDPVAEDVMTRPPRRMSSRLLGGSGLVTLAVRGGVLASGCLVAVAIAHRVWALGPEPSRTVLFLTLGITQLVYATVVRRPPVRIFDEPASVMRRRLTSNPWLLAGILLGGLMLVLVMVLPGLRDVFGLALIGMREWALVLGAAIVPNVAIVAFEPPARRR